MLEDEKRRLKEEQRKKRGLLEGIDVCGEVLNDLIGAIYIRIVSDVDYIGLKND